VNKPVRLLTSEEATRSLRQIDRARERAMRERGIGWAYAGDEMFFIGDEQLPEDGYYDDWPLTENGVGAVRRLLDDFESGLAAVPRFTGQRIAIVTGTRMAPVLQTLIEPLERQTGARVTVHPAVNRMYGETVTTAGLLPGRDIAEAMSVDSDIVLIPAEALNDDDVFVDNYAFADLRASFPNVRVIAAHEITSALTDLG
jgi:NifB/MoaA-like Fe-S oxidoreductase